MRRLLLALPFALLPGFVLAAGQHDHDHDHDHHDSLGAHEHGAAELDAALDGSMLEIELRSPAMNLVGFEHTPSSDADKRKIADARERLEQPVALFGLPAAAGCKLAETELESPLFEGKAHDHGDEHEHDGDHESQHSEIHAHYHFDCATPQAIQVLDLQGLFKAFPGTKKIQAQLIGPNGQRGAQLDADQPRATF
ncbi:DUF2796 domain-containing protein [Pseudomonas stutzeri]|uniref:DUF2796 domain-containing protein n=1 Tax=Stutzerimonas stutzeri TaxID=316 RepID=A0A2N8SR50_STUST|nr:DUF2796 domain-containing protein [Stutzerimonas stutzeri]MCQ4251304.1 DUF2796 domain-containing protein [Stutzerimonas stutzeri]PNG04967.1 DUF2796 domain-containing protein [Stutzerimonas stutzeri]